MHYKFCVSVWNNWDEYVCNIEKLKSMSFFVLLVYIWKMINESHRYTKRLFIYFPGDFEILGWCPAGHS